MADNWFTLLNASGIISELFFTAFTLHKDTRTRRVSNLLKLTKNHREIWNEIFNRPNLSRVLEMNVDTTQYPVTRDEEIFVNLVVQHLSSVYQAMRYDLTFRPQGLERDVA